MIAKWLGAVLLTVGAAGTVAAEEACLEADEVGSAAGVLAADGDGYILTVGAPICLKGTDDVDNVQPTTRLQVLPGSEPLQGAMQALIGKPVAVKGRLFGGRSAMSSASILMEVSEAVAK